jgi:hypothetical protein
MDEATIAVWTQIGALIVQIVTIGIAIWVFRRETHQSQALLSIDLLFKLEEKFNSDTLRKARAEAASGAISILEGQSGEEQDVRQAQAQEQVRMDEILNFFDMLGLMVKQGRLDKKYAHFQFAYWLKHYYAFTHEYIRRVQKSRPQQWKYIPWIYDEFLKMKPQQTQEEFKENDPSSNFLLSKKDLNDFFDSESKLI